MKILLGIDKAGHYRSALSLLSRLRFPEEHTTLLYVDEHTSFPVALPNTPTFSGTEKPVTLDWEGVPLLQRAEREADEAGLHPKTMYEAGNAAEELVLQASQIPASLIAIGSRSRRPALAALLGSVGRSLATTAPHSFLVAHGEVAPLGEIRALFATDHSNYADEALETLLRWAPQGLEHLSVLHALEHTSDGEISEGVARTETVARRIREAGISAKSVVHAGKPSSVIHSEMDRGAYDLLIVAARGHGVLERTILGSVAIALVTASPFPTLVLRP